MTPATGTAALHAPRGAPAQRELRWLADAYEQAQRSRIDAGERIRAILQARDGDGSATPLPAPLVETTLHAIRRGEAEAPSALLGWTYRRHWEEERELQRGMESALAAHPAWPWLSSVRGVGATLACKLLARLDLDRATSPSSFWAYCGLATVPGVEYECRSCGLRMAFTPEARVTGRHQARGTNRPCADQLVRTRGPEHGVRVAQPRARRGEVSSYDRAAKKTCYLIGVSLIRAGGPYADSYRSVRVRLEAQRSGWPRARIHLTALRRIEKQFLADLWNQWRAAVGLPPTLSVHPGTRQDREVQPSAIEAETPKR